MSITVRVENMTEKEITAEMLERIEASVNILFQNFESMFVTRDKDETTPQLILLTSMGAHAAAILAIVNKLKTQFEILSDIESEEDSNVREDTTIS